MSLSADPNSWETHEVVTWLSNEGAWPVEPRRSDRIADIAADLKEAVEGDKQGYAAIHESFVQNAGDWRKVDWEDLADSLMRELHGDDYMYLLSFTLSTPIKGTDEEDLANKLRAIAKAVEDFERSNPGEDNEGPQWEVEDL